jgi:hypothetical protein
MVDISIDGVARISLSAIEEYELEEDDEESEPYYRTLTIVTMTGEVIELDLNAASEEALEVMEDDEDEDED